MRNWSHLSPINAEYILGNYGKKTIIQIATDLNMTVGRVTKFLKMNGVYVMSKSEFYKQLNGMKFEYEDELCNDFKNGYTQNQLMGKYKIGNDKLVMILDRNNIDRYKGKGARQVRVWADGKRKARNCNKGGTKNIHNALYKRWISNAKSRSYPFEVSIDYLQTLLEKQNFKCAYSNIDLLAPSNYLEKLEMTSSPYLISLDRIDSNKGYIEGNVQFVCVCINKAKGSYNDEQFKEIIRKIRQV